MHRKDSISFPEMQIILGIDIVVDRDGYDFPGVSGAVVHGEQDRLLPAGPRLRGGVVRGGRIHPDTVFGVEGRGVRGNSDPFLLIRQDNLDDVDIGIRRTQGDAVVVVHEQAVIGIRQDQRPVSVRAVVLVPDALVVRVAPGDDAEGEVVLVGQLHITLP